MPLRNPSCVSLKFRSLLMFCSTRPRVRPSTALKAWMTSSTPSRYLLYSLSFIFLVSRSTMRGGTALGLRGLRVPQRQNLALALGRDTGPQLAACAFPTREMPCQGVARRLRQGRYLQAGFEGAPDARLVKCAHRSALRKPPRQIDKGLHVQLGEKLGRHPGRLSRRTGLRQRTGCGHPLANDVPDGEEARGGGDVEHPQGAAFERIQAEARQIARIDELVRHLRVSRSQHFAAPRGARRPV